MHAPERLALDAFADQHDAERPIRDRHHADKARAATRRAFPGHDQWLDQPALLIDDLEPGLPDRLVAADVGLDWIAAAYLRLAIDVEQARAGVQHRRVLDVEVDEPDLLDGSRRSNVAERPRLFRDVQHGLALCQQRYAQAECDYESHVYGCANSGPCACGAREDAGEPHCARRRDSQRHIVVGEITFTCALAPTCGGVMSSVVQGTSAFLPTSSFLAPNAAVRRASPGEGARLESDLGRAH